MTFFGVLAILTILINVLPLKSEKQYSARLIVSLIPLFLFGATRENFGQDYIAYASFFEQVKFYEYNPNVRMEVGYYYLNKLLPNFRSLLVVQTLLLCVSYYYLFKWYIPYKYAWLGFVLLFLNSPFTVFFMLSGIRNGISISILILSSYFIYKKKLPTYILLIFIASLFHKSILIVGPIAYFMGIKEDINQKSLIIWLSVIVFIAVASTTILLDYASLFITEYFDRYETYIEIAKAEDGGAGLLISLFSIIISALFLYMIYGNKLSQKENMVVRFTLIYFISYLLGPLNMRMSQYFASFFVVGSVILSSKTIETIPKTLYFIAIYGYLIYALKLWIESPNFSYSTYQTVLF